MSEVWIRRDEAERGSLPARCARSGQRCLTRYATSVRTLPPALEWATWSRAWPFVSTPTAGSIVLPLLPRRRATAVIAARVRDASAALLLIGLVAALLTDGGVPGRIAGAVVLGSILAHVVTALVGLLAVVDVRADVTGGWIRLSGVHPGFVAATEDCTTRPATEPVLATVEGSVDPAADPSSGA